MKKQQNLSFGIPGEEYVFDGRRIFISRKGVIRLSGDAVVLYQLMDGKTSDRRLIENFNKCRDSRLYPADLRRFVRQLTRKNLLCGRVNGCLASKASPYYQRRMLDAFDKMTVREALYAGIGYKADPTALRKDLKECFDAVPEARLDILCRRRRRIRGVIVPHSNMELAGPCAAWAYKAVSRLPLPDTCIILGPCHAANMKSPYCVLDKDFHTPLGRVGVDVDLVRMLDARSRLDLFRDRLAHLTEHSIEIQLPYLQYIYKKNRAKLRIVPILCSPSLSSGDRASFVRCLKHALAKSRQRNLIIATSDLVHGGRNNPAYFHSRNGVMLRCLQKGSAEDFNRRIGINKYRLCGKATILPLLKTLAPSRGVILNYSWASKAKAFDRYLTYDVHPDIGYASVIFD